MRVPGTLATWQSALKTWGTRSLGQALKPATMLARDGFVVDRTLRLQAVDNAARFSAFPATRALFLPGGAPPAVGTMLRNPIWPTPTPRSPATVRRRSTASGSGATWCAPRSTHRSTRPPRSSSDRV